MGRAKRGGQSALPMGTSEFFFPARIMQEKDFRSEAEARATARGALARSREGLSIARNSRERIESRAKKTP